MPSREPKTISVVVPCYNEAEVLHAFLDSVRSVARRMEPYRFELLFVDDGSTDETEAILDAEARHDARIKILVLAANVGHQRAIMAGLEHCTGDYIVVIDADLQDPPALILEMVARLEEGFDIVHAVRNDRSVDSPLKRLTARVFYLLMRRFVQPDLVENASDFKAFNRAVLTALLAHKQRVLFMRGLTSALGFRQSTIPFTRAMRHAGDTKYPLKKQLRFARDAVLGNSILPLRLAALPGLLALGVLPVYFVGLLTLWSRFSLEFNLVMFMLGCIGVLGALILSYLGLAAEYLGLIVQEVQQRPRYHLRKIHHYDEAETPTPPTNREREPLG